MSQAINILSLFVYQPMQQETQKSFSLPDCAVVAAVIFSDRTELRRTLHTSGEEGMRVNEVNSRNLAL